MRGGGVGVYLKEHFKCREMKDIHRLYTTIEHLWLEINGKSKNNSYLLGICYQPSSIIANKEVWLEHVTCYDILEWTDHLSW